MRKFIPTFLFAIFPAVASAQTTYKLLAPLGPLSGSVTLQTYLEGIVLVTIGVAGILAVLMIVICGIKMIGSPSVAQKQESKDCILAAIMGLLLAVGSWLILNTINQQLLTSDFSPAALPTPGAVAPGATTTAPLPTANGCYFRYREVSSGNVRYQRQDTCAMCESMRVNFQADPTLITVETRCFEVGGTAPGTPTPASPPPASAAGDARCVQSGLNLHEGQFRQCWNSSCQQFVPLVSGKVVSAQLLMAVILQESICGQQLVGDAGASCGPTHIQLAVANIYRAQCGVPAGTVLQCGWLTEKENWDAAICMSARYLNSFSGSCGTGAENLYAGYNGGPGACQTSANCTGLRRWECLYDDNAHQVCNARYNTLRNATTQVLYCTQNPGGTGY